MVFYQDIAIEHSCENPLQVIWIFQILLGIYNTQLVDNNAAVKQDQENLQNAIKNRLEAQELT